MSTEKGRFHIEMSEDGEREGGRALPTVVGLAPCLSYVPSLASSAFLCDHLSFLSISFSRLSAPTWRIFRLYRAVERFDVCDAPFRKVQIHFRNSWHPTGLHHRSGGWGEPHANWLSYRSTNRRPEIPPPRIDFEVARPARRTVATSQNRRGHVGRTARVRAELRRPCLEEEREAKGWEKVVPNDTGRCCVTTSKESPNLPYVVWPDAVVSNAFRDSSTRRHEGC